MASFIRFDWVISWPETTCITWLIAFTCPSACSHYHIPWRVYVYWFFASKLQRLSNMVSSPGQLTHFCWLIFFCNNGFPSLCAQLYFTIHLWFTCTMKMTIIDIRLAIGKIDMICYKRISYKNATIGQRKHWSFRHLHLHCWPWARNILYLDVNWKVLQGWCIFTYSLDAKYYSRFVENDYLV